MICKSCGREIAETSKFCGYCGNKVEPAVSFDTTPSVNTDDLNIFNNAGGVSSQPVVKQDTPEPVVPDYSWISETAPKEPQVQNTPTNNIPTINDNNTIENEINNELKFNVPEQPSSQTLYERFNIESPTVAPTPVQPASVQPAPVQPVPVQLDPVQPQVEPTPVAPTQPIPVQPAPVEPLPIVEPENSDLDNIELKPFADIQPQIPEVKEEPVVEVKQEEDKKSKKKENKEEKESNKKDFTTAIIVFLTVVVVMLSAFIVWDKFLNNENDTNNSVGSSINNNTTNMTDKDALEIVEGKYSSVYGDSFKLIYDDLKSGNTTQASSMFTNDAIAKLKANADYKVGIFGTENQTARKLEVVSYGDEYIIAKGKNDTDTAPYYIVLKKIDGVWYIDMFE